MNAPQIEHQQMVKFLDETERVLLDPVRQQQYDDALQAASTNLPQAREQVQEAFPQYKYSSEWSRRGLRTHVSPD